MCFCSCLPMTSSSKNVEDAFGDEDNQTFVYSPFKRTEIQRKQFKKPSSTSDLFTIFDKSLLESNENNISTINTHSHRQSLSSSSSHRVFDSNRLSHTSNNDDLVYILNNLKTKSEDDYDYDSIAANMQHRRSTSSLNG